MKNKQISIDTKKRNNHLDYEERNSHIKNKPHLLLFREIKKKEKRTMKGYVRYILLVAALFTSTAFAQVVAVKTNLLYDATTTINLGVEFKIAPQWSMDISGNVNPWTFSDNRKMKFWLLQPEARWWSCQPFNGHFFGIHALGGKYNIGGMLPWGFKNGQMMGFIKNENILEHRYEGWTIGAGVSYGYHWILGKRWGLEATIGVGYAYLNYDKYKCEHCGEKIKEGNRNYFGPTKAGVTLIYMIK